MALEKYDNEKLIEIVNNLGLPKRKNKSEMIRDIENAFEAYKEDKIDRYKKYEQLGQAGKEGITFRVTDRQGKEYAMKTFRKTKSSAKLAQEYILQEKASKRGIAPKVYKFDTVTKYIVMEKMDTHLLETMKKEKGLSKTHQLRILEIFNELDKAGVFHNDANLCNYMFKGDKLYIIDFGFAKEINDKLLKTTGPNPNANLMLIGFVMKLKEMEQSPSSYKYLIKNISDSDILKYNLKK